MHQHRWGKQKSPHEARAFRRGYRIVIGVNDTKLVIGVVEKLSAF